MTRALASPSAGNAPLLAARLLMLAVILLFTVSPMALSFVGVKYDLPEGPFWQKLHPCTLVAMLAMLVDIVARPHPLRRLEQIATRFPGAMYFIATWILLIVHGLLNQQAQFTALIEPYALSLVALFMVDQIGDERRNFLRLFLHGAILANALVGIVEFVSHARLFPYVIGGVEVDGDYRSTALLGHPLLNASTTGAYILCLVMGGDNRLSTVWRVSALLASAFGMIAFGGRTAIAASSLIIVLIALKNVAAILLGARVDIRRVLAALVIAPLLLGGVAGAAQAGAFDAFVARYVDDNGSGEARLIALELFNMFDLGDLLIGPRPDLVNSGLKLLGIEIGIENNWLAMLFQYGAWMEAFFTVALFALFFEFWRRGRPGVTLLFAYFIAVISSAIGLAAKTLIFAQFSILLLVLFARDEGPRPRING
ncbi:VpsF family polysaccharide biosynthesis protein [Methylocystis sp. JAN1]|uniref:VpsF family polysaccharide biosynthesis protein n=1 Tax=Methylocystis sp. JAN1 TaxID=3397211 RepID=UPI003FA2A3E0